MSPDYGLEFWEGGECLKDFPCQGADTEDWEPELFRGQTGSESRPFPRPPSPTPSFVRYFEGHCLCEYCSPNGPITYASEVEAEKRKLYDAWKSERARKWKELESRRREEILVDLLLTRKRAVMVVQEAFGLDEAETRSWEEKSYGRWWEATREVLGPTNLPFEHDTSGLHPRTNSSHHLSKLVSIHSNASSSLNRNAS